MGQNGQTTSSSAIARLRALDRVADPALQSLARLAARVTGSSSAAIHILDDDTQHRIAAHGQDLVPTPREHSFCRLVVEGKAPVVTAKATGDKRFAYSPFAHGPDAVRYYAGVPLRARAGEVIGTICIWGQEEIELPADTEEVLDEIAEQAMLHLELTTLIAELGTAASEDALTGLANRLILDDRLAHHLARRQRHEFNLLVAVVDLDGFKAINDEHGHAAGDEVLRATAGRLAGCMRPEDTVARTGGDEFVVVAELDPNGAGLDELTERLRNCIAQPIELASGVVVRPLGTVGAVLAEVDEEPAAVVARADAAMYALKPGCRARELP